MLDRGGFGDSTSSGDGHSPPYVCERLAVEVAAYFPALRRDVRRRITTDCLVRGVLIYSWIITV